MNLIHPVIGRYAQNARQNQKKCRTALEPGQSKQKEAVSYSKQSPEAVCNAVMRISGLQAFAII